MPSRSHASSRSVFLNFPFNKSYERLFVALIAALVALGRTPRCVLEVPETGDGRLARIFDLIRSCPVSIHDLSAVGLPVRFNMPFELGLAVALKKMGRNHAFILLEAKRHRLQTTLSDVNGFDPGIHGATVKGIIACVVYSLPKAGGVPTPAQVKKIHRELWKTVPYLKRQHGRSNIYSRAIFSELLAAAVRLARRDGLIAGGGAPI